MGTSASTIDHLLDSLAPLQLTTRKMFGELSQSINTSKFGSSPPASPARR